MNFDLSLARSGIPEPFLHPLPRASSIGGLFPSTSGHFRNSELNSEPAPPGPNIILHALCQFTTHNGPRSYLTFRGGVILTHTDRIVHALLSAMKINFVPSLICCLCTLLAQHFSSTQWTPLSSSE